MAQSIQPGRFGHSGGPDDAWRAKQENEPILEPGLPIIVATVFAECRSMYRANGPVEMRPVGEVEFDAGIAAMSASGDYGPIKVAQSIVGHADLALGDRVEPMLEALIRAGVGRLSGVRYSVG